MLSSLLPKPVYMSQKALQSLKDYKYTAGKISTFESFLNKYYWTTMVEFMPRWLAPNMISLLGLIVTSVVAAMMYPYDMKTESSQLIYFLASFSIFAY